MAVTVPSIPAVTLGTASTTVYTVPNTAGFYLIVKGIIIANMSASSFTFSLARVPSGGTETDSNRFLKLVSLAAYESVFLSDTITLGANESIRGTASFAASAVVTLSGAGKLS